MHTQVDSSSSLWCFDDLPCHRAKQPSIFFGEPRIQRWRLRCGRRRRIGGRVRGSAAGLSRTDARSEGIDPALPRLRAIYS